MIKYVIERMMACLAIKSDVSYFTAGVDNGYLLINYY